METILLNLIEENGGQGIHGYAVFTAVKKKFGVHLGPSTLYPELKDLEKQGLISSSWEIASGKARRKYYITQKGQHLLKEYFVELQVVIPSIMSHGKSDLHQ